MRSVPALLRSAAKLCEVLRHNDAVPEGSVIPSEEM